MYPRRLAGPLMWQRTCTLIPGNVVVNTSANPLQIRNELARGNVDRHHLHGVLHETTHFATYFTPVGAILAALSSAHTSDPLSFIADQETVVGPARTAIQAELVRIIFTPILEGLALYAEFDAAPGISPIVSTTSKVGLRIFAMQEYRHSLQKAGCKAPFDFYADFLAAQRSSLETFDRKKILFSSSLADAGGYLLGYLGVKALWRILVAESRWLVDTDLYLSFLIDFLFGDYRLACLLLNWMPGAKSEVSLETDIADIQTYIFNYRLPDLIDNVDQYVTEYMMHAAKEQGVAGYPSYHNFTEDFDLHFHLAYASGTGRARHFMWPDFASARYILRIFSAPAEVTITKEGSYLAVIRGTAETLEGTALEDVRPLSGQQVSGDGSIEVVFLDPMCVVYCVFLGDELVGTVDVVADKQNNDMTVKACLPMASCYSLETAAVQIAAEAQFRAGSKAEALHQELRAKTIEQIYLSFSSIVLSADVGDKQHTNVLRELDAGGIAALLKDYPGMLDWLVRLSMSGTAWTSIETAANRWSTSRAEIAQWIERINVTLRELCGNEAFIISGDKFAPTQF